MARYIGPKSKIARKFGEPIYGPDKAFEHKNFPPGMHGNSKRRKKVSEYGTQLKEKQKAKRKTLKAWPVLRVVLFLFHWQLKFILPKSKI